MMGRTHGQSATPTTMGKEIANYAYRLNVISKEANKVGFGAKLNGAVGNYNAHEVVYPEFDWIQSFQGVHRVPRPAVDTLLHADRKPRLHVPVLRPPEAPQHRAHRTQPRLLALHQPRLLQAEDCERRDRLLDHAPQGQSHRLSKTLKATWESPTHSSAISPRSCPSVDTSATSATPPYSETWVWPSGTPASPTAAS
jgi:hypothetical protein